jgi:hypothetical protein
VAWRGYLTRHRNTRTPATRRSDGPDPPRSPFHMQPPRRGSSYLASYSRRVSTGYNCTIPFSYYCRRQVKTSKLSSPSFRTSHLQAPKPVTIFAPTDPASLPPQAPPCLANT